MRVPAPALAPIPTPGPPVGARRPPGGAPARRALLAALAGLAALLFVASCAVREPGLHRVNEPEARRWVDDGSQESLERAVGQSIRYYRRLPEDVRFRIAGRAYSPREMIRSLELFRRLARDPERLRERLGEDFLVFESVSGRPENLFTGYYVPVIPGAETPTEKLDTPLYRRPGNLVVVELDRFAWDLPRQRLVGRLEGDRVLPYYDRREIQEQDALRDQAEPLAYVDRIDLFFLQIQGSGVVEFRDGRRLLVGYAGSNGHPYRSLGAELIRRDRMAREEVTMQSLRSYLHRHPEEAASLLNANPSYVFFRPLESERPLGSIEVPLTAGRSLAVDDRLFPAGGLAYLKVEVPVPGEPEATRTMRRFFLIQDTGGAISGHGRADVYWGEGDAAEWVAGHMKHPGRMFLLVAKKSVLRTLARNEATGPLSDLPVGSLP